MKSLIATNENLTNKLNYLQSDSLDNKDFPYSHDPLICELKKKLNERQRNLASVDELQTLTEENSKLNEELIQTQLMVKELQSLYDNKSNKNDSSGVLLHNLLMRQKCYELSAVSLDLQNSTSGLGVTVNKHRDTNYEGTYIQKVSDILPFRDRILELPLDKRNPRRLFKCIYLRIKYSLPIYLFIEMNFNLIRFFCEMQFLLHNPTNFSLSPN